MELKIVIWFVYVFILFDMIFNDYFFKFLQKHAIMVETALLKEMPDALSAPFPEMFYLQAQIAETQVNKKTIRQTIKILTYLKF